MPAQRPLIPPARESSIKNLMLFARAGRRKAWRCLITSEFSIIERCISAVSPPDLPLCNPRAKPALCVAASCSSSPVLVAIAWRCGSAASGATSKTAFWMVS
eukprot:8334375-Pyramimonas_sp.AAC.1